MSFPAARATTAINDLDTAPDGRLLLLAPSANRVYAGDAPRLNAAEILVMSRAFGIQADVEPVRVQGVDYLHVSGGDDQLGRIVSEASGAFAAFAVTDGLLRPERLARRQLYPDDVITIQKYQGKTNEQFTHLLINVTAALAKRPASLFDGTLQLLDPMCGRGTTLNTALLRGIQVTGIDVDRSDFEHYQAFITTWLRTHRLKHDLHTEQIRRNGETFGRALDVETAPSKDAWKSGETQQITYLSMDTTKAHRVLRKASVDVIVADTPYGVQHGSHGDNVERSPRSLLRRSLPAWHTVLRTGGTVGLAYNRHVAPAEEMAELLDAGGFEVVHGAGTSAPGLEGIGEDAFRHRVDSSIDRDIVIARKV